MSEVDLEAAKALLVGITDGPWIVEREVGYRHVSGHVEAIGPLSAAPCGYQNSYVLVGDEDAAFIAASRTLVPELIAEIERLRAELDEMKQIEEDRYSERDDSYPDEY